MVWLIIIISLLLFISGILFLPVRIVASSERMKYSIQLPIYFKVQLVPAEQLFHLRFRIFFIPFKFNPFKPGEKKDKKPKKEKKRKKNQWSIGGGIGMIKEGLRLFKIKRFYAEVDTGNFPLNAQLIPLVQTINRKSIHLTINFENINTVDFEGRIYIYKIMWFAIKNKNNNN